ELSTEEYHGKCAVTYRRLSYKALSSAVVEHSPFNPRNLPTTGLSVGRLRAKWRLSNVVPRIVIRNARACAAGGRGLCGRARSGHEHLRAALHAGRFGLPGRVARAGGLRRYFRGRRLPAGLCGRLIPPPPPGWRERASPHIPP